MGGTRVCDVSKSTSEAKEDPGRHYRRPGRCPTRGVDESHTGGHCRQYTTVEAERHKGEQEVAPAGRASGRGLYPLGVRSAHGSGYCPYCTTTEDEALSAAQVEGSRQVGASSSE